MKVDASFGVDVFFYQSYSYWVKKLLLAPKDPKNVKNNQVTVCLIPNKIYYT